MIECRLAKDLSQVIEIDAWFDDPIVHLGSSMKKLCFRIGPFLHVKVILRALPEAQLVCVCVRAIARRE